MKLPQKVITKKDKRKVARKKILVISAIVILFIALIPLAYFAFFNKGPLFITPLSGNQTTNINQLEAKLKEREIKFQEVITGNDLSFIIKLEGGSEVIVDPGKDIEQQLSSLQLISSQLTIEGKVFKKLDFRFEKPIIKF